MALIVDKTGKITEKHLTANIDDIKKALLNSQKNNSHQKILLKASQTKIVRRVVA